jgi:hypothetical protein
MARKQGPREKFRRQISRLAREFPTGAFPDFVIIGAQKAGTTSLYELLVKHPYVRGAARKELHFFDKHFEEGTEFYTRCFPQSEHRDGRRTITGEATPYYMFHPHTPGRLAQTAPRARLIALLRNPVDRAYSHYQMVSRRGEETLSFEDATAMEAIRLHDEMEKMLRDEHYVSTKHQNFSYLSRGIYVDQLRRWAGFFDRTSMLVLESSDFYEKPAESFGRILDFLDLPRWEPEAWEVYRRGEYEEPMDPATRRRLERYFEPHNKRLYDFLSTDFRW